MSKGSIAAIISSLSDQTLKELSIEMKKTLGLSDQKIADAIGSTRISVRSYVSGDTLKPGKKLAYINYWSEQIECNPWLLEAEEIQRLLPTVVVRKTENIVSTFTLGEDDLKLLLALVVNSGKPISLEAIPVILNKI